MNIYNKKVQYYTKTYVPPPQQNPQIPNTQMRRYVQEQEIKEIKIVIILMPIFLILKNSFTHVHLGKIVEGVVLDILQENIKYALLLMIQIIIGLKVMK